MRTFVMVKPDGVKKSLVGEVIRRFENFSFKLAALKVMKIDRKTAEKHYEMHKGKAFYEDLLAYITSGPVVPMVVEIDLSDEDGIKLVRKIVGKTNPLEAEMGSIRGDYATTISENIVHAADSPENAKREINIFFKENEIVRIE